VTMAIFPLSAVDISCVAGPGRTFWPTGAFIRGTGADRGCAAKTAPIYRARTHIEQTSTTDPRLKDGEVLRLSTAGDATRRAAPAKSSGDEGDDWELGL
jgi:hypothetical protein